MRLSVRSGSIQMVGVARPESSNGVEQAKTTPFEDSGRATQPLIHLAGVFVLLAGTVTGCHKADSVAPPEQADASSSPDELEHLPWFREITEEVGLNFVHDAGAVGRYFLPQATGSGGAVFDFDNDGKLDIYLLQNGGPNSRSTNRL